MFRHFSSFISRRVCCHPRLSGSLGLVLKAVCRGGKKKLPELQRSNYRGRFASRYIGGNCFSHLGVWNNGYEQQPTEPQNMLCVCIIKPNVSV